MTRPFRVVLFAAWTGVAMFVLLEIAVRLWGYSEPHMHDAIYMPFPASDEIPYVHKPGLLNARARGLAIINTDSLGLRAVVAGESSAPRRPDEYRIAIVGDSCTFGEGVKNTEDTYPHVLEVLLNRSQDARSVRVFNFAASAYNVRTMAATLDHRMLDVKPDLVLMSIIPADFDLSRTPEVSRWGYFTDRQGLLSADSYLRLVLRRLHLVYPVRNVLFGHMHEPPEETQARLARTVPASYSTVRAFASTAKRHAIPYRIVLLPSTIGFGRIADQLRDDGLSVVDLTPLKALFTPDQFRASRFDPHPSAAVHRRIAEVLAGHLHESELRHR